MDDEEFYYGTFSTATLLICLFGYVGNVHVIWLLCYRVKKNAFSTHVLNLAIADSGTVAFLAILLVLEVARSSHRPSLLALHNLFVGMHMVSLCFLAAIGVERCASLFFPRWYQHSRPKFLSNRLSLLIWTLSGVVCVMQVSYNLAYGIPLEYISKIMLIVNKWFLPPLLAICTSVLLIQLCCQYRKRPLGNLNTVIILMLFYYLTFHGLCIVLSFLPCSEDPLLVSAFYDLLFSVNSSIKPIFYSLVGRQWKCCSTEPLEIELQRVFQDEGKVADSRDPMGVNPTAEETCNDQTA